MKPLHWVSFKVGKINKLNFFLRRPDILFRNFKVNLIRWTSANSNYFENLGILSHRINDQNFIVEYRKTPTRKIGWIPGCCKTHQKRFYWPMCRFLWRYCFQQQIDFERLLVEETRNGLFCQVDCQATTKKIVTTVDRLPHRFLEKQIRRSSN